MKPPAPTASEIVAAPPKKSFSSPHLATAAKKYTMAEVEKHSTEDSCWFVVDGSVYDATSYLNDHPGGKASILLNAGMDATEEFLAIHSEKARRMLEDYYIGDLVGEEEKEEEKLHVSKSSAALLKMDLPNQEVRTIEDNDTASKLELVALNPRKWIDFELVEKINVSHDTRLFKFALQSPEHRLGLPVGYHMFVKGKIDGKVVMRAYTPVSSDDDLGTFTMCIKVYFPNVHPKFPDGGKMSQYIDGLKIGESLSVKGPLGHFEYKGRGRYVLNGKEGSSEHFGFICGGTGLTPAYQVLQAVMKDPEDSTNVHLLYANKTEGDILMREELDKMAEARDNIHVWYTLDNPPEGWKYSQGFISEQMIKDSLPEAQEGVLVGMCGPKPMIDFACVPNLKKLGFVDSQFFSF